MGKIITTTWVSLDGFIAGPSGEMDWILVEQEMGKYEYEAVSAADTLLLGRVTYESFAGSWPHVPDNPNVSLEEKVYANRLNEMRKIVVSRTLGAAEWNNSTLLKEVVPEEITRLKEQTGGDILIYGSASLIQTLANYDLIDEYQVLLHPVVLGGGKPLFKDIQRRQKLKLVNTKSFPSGVIGLYYQPDK